MSIPDQVLPIVEAIANGVPLGKLKPRETCPTLPAIPMMVAIDDIGGQGPSAFDSTRLFDQVDSVVIAVPLAFAEGAAATAARARSGDRALMIQTPTETVAQWLALVSERRKLARHFLCLVGGDVPNDVTLMLNDIEALASAKMN